ncbi:helix-turn-helix domain-containing protein [Jatrophihabitans lederbergiae]|uniref:Helix-turn-helix domain-containing protein n=1 Tax=Jatrophihabitans lederbergiae TaxID=3075547 RepID=A0ABU2JJ04_9ACTN|nr:helix-turn-helix domain-containing protein [Jatrophihabitans sp. DSM 44399]MDT0264469.1 helix-turn-helix domain-containing protein [Jatrophihabitans sp. DSM 44399]
MSTCQGALAEFERQLISERTRAGLQAARAGGRRPALSADQQALLRQLYDQRQHTIAQIASMLGVSRPTVYRYLGAESP